MTYRISYTYTGPSIPGDTQEGDRLELLQTTSNAFDAYYRFERNLTMADVVLEQYQDGAWLQLLPPPPTTPTPTSWADHWYAASEEATPAPQWLEGAPPTTPEPTLTALGMGGWIGGGDPLEEAELEVAAAWETQEAQEAEEQEALEEEALGLEDVEDWQEVEEPPYEGGSPEELAALRAEQERWADLTPEQQWQEIRTRLMAARALPLRWAR